MFDVNEKLMREVLDAFTRTLTAEIRKAFRRRAPRRTGPLVLDTSKHKLSFSIHLDN